MRVKIHLIILLMLTAPVLPCLSASGQQSATRVRVVADLANIRREPSIQSPIIAQKPRGAVLEVESRTEEWYKIRLGDDESRQGFGYVHQSLVAPVSQSQPETKERTRPTEKPPTKRPETEPPQVLYPRDISTSSTETEPKRLEISLYGGGQTLSGGDLNDGAKGLTQFYAELKKSAGAVEFSPTHLGYVFGAELQYPLSSYVSLGLGLEYLNSTKESQVLFEQSSVDYAVVTKPRLSALPIRAVVILKPLTSLFLKGGIEYILADCSYYYRIKEGESWQEWLGEASAGSFSLVGGFGFVKELNPYFGLFFETLIRRARISGFTGQDTFTDSSGLSSTESGLLYLYRGQISPDRTYPLLFIRDRTPSEAGVLDPREATVDFSGFSLRAGIQIRF